MRWFWATEDRTEYFKYENQSIDVVRNGCFSSFNAIACASGGVLSLLSGIVALLCFVRVIKLHLKRHPQLHQYLIFYFAALECLLGSIYWGAGYQYLQVDMTLSYMKLLQFVVICHFYWNLATRILHKENLVKRVIVPILVVYVIYFTVVCAFGMNTQKSSWVECLEPVWLSLSAAEFLAVQLFMVAGIYITKKLNQISTDETFKRSQKCDLWSVIIVYETSALVNLTYDGSMNLLGNEEIGCSGVFGHVQTLYSIVFALFMIVKFILPVGVLLCVFHPTQLDVVDHESILGWSFDGTASTSVFRRVTQGPTFGRQIHFPSGDSFTVQSTGSSESNKGDHRYLNPSISGADQGYVKRLQTTLAPITEEDGTTESLSSDRSSVPEPGLLPDNQPLIKTSGSSCQKGLALA